MYSFVVLFVIALCGTCTSSNIDRIAGGFPASAHNQFPYMVSLQQKSLVNTLTRGHRCGGALVTLRTAVTAATCVFNSQNGVHTALNPNDYRVFAGAIDLTNDTSADRHRDVERFTVNPNYRAGTFYINDIAIIILTSPFSNNFVQVVALASSDVQASLTSCTSSGWGSQNDTNVPSTQLMHLQKYVMADNIQCQSYYTGSFVPQLALQSSMICGLSVGTASSCQGDLGNPLVCNGNLQGILISTAHSNCSEVILTPRPELYTRISSFRSWIRDNSGASTFQPTMAVLAVITIVQIFTTNVLN